MKTGIIYYSRTGNTKQAAETIEKKLKNKKIDVKLFEIKHVKKPGFFKAGYAAMRQKELPIIDVDFDLKKYDLLLFGSPIWAGKPAPFIKTFINKLEKFIRNDTMYIDYLCRKKGYFYESEVEVNVMLDTSKITIVSGKINDGNIYLKNISTKISRQSICAKRYVYFRSRTGYEI